MKLSIITVCFNSERYIADNVESVIMQTSKNFEHIIIDGNSSDQTVEIVCSRSNIAKVISEPDFGIYDAMNKGIRLSSGEFIGVLNSDDFFLTPKVLEDIERELDDDSCDILICGVDYARDVNMNKPIRNYKIDSFKRWYLKIGIMPPHAGIFIRRNLFERYGYYKLNYEIAADFEMMVRLLLVKKIKIKKYANIITRMRVGGVSTSGLSSTLTITREMNRALRENGFKVFPLQTLLRLPIKLITQVFLKGLKKP